MTLIIELKKTNIKPSNESKLILNERFTKNLFLFIAISLSVFTLFIFSNDIHTKENFNLSIAELDYHREHGEDSTLYIYKYKVNDEEFIYETLNYEGDDFEIFYNANNPKEFRVLTSPMIYLLYITFSCTSFLAWNKLRKI